MTIRSGGGPRDDRRTNTPYDESAYATGPLPAYQPRYAAARRRGSGGGIPGILKFLVFAAVLVGVMAIAAVTALRPIVAGVLVDWAGTSPGAYQYPFVHDLVRDDIGSALTQPGGSSSEDVSFEVRTGDTVTSVAERLHEQGLLVDPRAFVLVSVDRDKADSLQAGTFVLRANMTPDQIVTTLSNPPPPVAKYVDITFRESLRLEQLTAKLQTIDGLAFTPKEFYDLVKTPPAALIESYPWLGEVLPKGASLEGFLAPATYRVLLDSSAEDLVRQMLDKWIATVGQDRLAVPKARGLNFYQVLTLASIVEREAVVEEEKPLIAGVYQNRLSGIKGVVNKLLNADPTVIYAYDTAQLAQMPFDDWKTYVFWKVPPGRMDAVAVPPALQGYQTYQQPGLPPGPIATPTVGSIDAALKPSTKDKYLYFVAVPDGNGTHKFAKTYAEFQKLLQQYGY